MAIISLKNPLFSVNSPHLTLQLQCAMIASSNIFSLMKYT